jgi:CRISPR system Cascade subunit CasE
VVTLNPGRRDKSSGAIVPIRGRPNIERWFLDRAQVSWGFEVRPQYLQTLHIGVQVFAKGPHTVTHGSATLRGELCVTNREKFRQSFLQGVGRGRAFGFGLLQLVRLS